MLRRLVPLVAGLTLLGACPAFAHHRQTPPIVPLTTSGEADLPRLPAPGRTTLVVAIPTLGGTAIYTVMPYAIPMTGPPIVVAGDNRNPTVSLSGRVVAYDTDTNPFGSGPGRQVVVARRGTLIAGTADPSGTSGNPALDLTGTRYAFESTGDLANTGNFGVRQIFYGLVGGGVSQLSTGFGISRNPAIAPRRGWLAFESTSDPATGDDTEIEQIWLGSVRTLTVAPLTAGLAPSTRPSFSDDGTMLTFQSGANLAGDGADTGVPQVFVYETRSRTMAQVTFDPAGCSSPAIAKVGHDWRVGFVCGGLAYYYMLSEDKLYRVDTPDGDASRIVPELGIHFVVVATNGNMTGSGPTPGHQLYLVNLYKRPGTPIPGAPTAVWFPFRGIK